MVRSKGHCHRAGKAGLAQARVIAPDVDCLNLRFALIAFMDSMQERRLPASARTEEISDRFVHIAFDGAING